MKKTVFTLMAGVALLTACTPAQQKTTLTGTLEGMESDTLIVRYQPIVGSSNNGIDTTLVLKDSRFTLDITNDTIPMEVFIRPNANNVHSGISDQIFLLICPGEQMNITGNFEQYQVTGSDFQQAYQAAHNLWEPMRNQLTAMTEQIIALQQEGLPFDSLRLAQYPIYQKMREMQKQYVVDHPDTDVSLYILSQLNMEAIEELLPTFTEKVSKGTFAPLYKAMDEAVQKERAREEAEKNIVEGAEAPDFTLKDLNGNDLALSSLRGKYVVLDFWGSWCGWCIKGIPDMKKYYEKYKGKMEILGIDCRDTEEKWKAAVEKHELPWLHVRNEGNPDVSLLYAIQGYPTKIVIDPEGKIAKVVIGEDPAFYEYLDELFK